LILDAWADRETKNLDCQLEVVVDRELASGATQDTTLLEDVLDHCESGILQAVIAGVDGELDHLCGLARKAHLRDLASSQRRTVSRIMSLSRSRAE